MATAYKCDRCGALYEGYVERSGDEVRMIKRITSNDPHIDGMTKPVDLCENCWKKFDAWFNKENKED